MPLRPVVVQKTRRMIADELADAIGASEWERAHFDRLSRRTLAALATRAIPGWRDVATVAAS